MLDISQPLKHIEDLARKGGDTRRSYTQQLMSEGINRICKKFGEEAVELIIAATTAPNEEIVAEAADVLYHLTILLVSCNITYHDVAEELIKRQSQSGIEEKNNR